MAGTDGSLHIVGTGIQAAGQLTTEARAHVERAGKLLYLVAHPTTEYQLQQLNATAESLHPLYETGKERFVSYMEMVDRILTEVRAGVRVCVAFYGHPGVFAFPGHEAVRLAREEGYVARMLPGISAEDCLFADLGVDPSAAGCQSFEATDFLLFARQFNPCSSLVLWQIGVIGDTTFQGDGYDTRVLSVLAERLEEAYGPDHRVVIYEASYTPVEPARTEGVTVGRLGDADVNATSTLYVPPKAESVIDEDMLARLGINRPAIRRTTVTLTVDRAAEGDRDEAGE